MSKNINDLRGHLFDSIEALKNGTMDVKTALAISDLGRTMVETAKVELAFMKQADRSNPNSPFLEPQRSLPPAEQKPAQLTEIARTYAKAQGVYYRLQDGELMPISLESITSAIGHAGLKQVTHYLSFTEAKKALLR